MRQVMLWLILISLTGCAGMGYREGDVKVTLTSLSILDSTLMEQRYLVRLRLQNRTRNPLEIEGMSFDVALNGKDFASGVSNRQIRVPAFDESILEVEVSSSLFGIIRQLQALQHNQHRSFDYELSGRAYLSGGMFSLPFKESGVIDLGLPKTPGDSGI